MVYGKITVPPSPPTSPRMSNEFTKSDEYSAHQGIAGTDTVHGSQERAGDPAQHHDAANHDRARPPMRSYNSVPDFLWASSGLRSDTNVAAAGQSADADGKAAHSGNLQPLNTRSETYGGSAPTSPASGLTPQSSKDWQNEVEAGGIALESEGEDQQDDKDEKRPMTAAELRAHKRKMKRFRLTHNQTRFLMSEFAKQAHPDAPHRERLSREIPGLSPRQVQVWFQNRRAKLKRLTTDDRERMMKSRALPANFDMTHALHSPFGARPSNGGTPGPSPEGLSQFGQPEGVRPLTLDTLKRVPDYEQQPYGHAYTSLTGMTPGMGGFAFTPPQSATDTTSPASANSNMFTFGSQAQDSPRRPSFPLQSNHPGYPGHFPQVPRLQIHDRLARPIGEGTGSPLRTSVSYSSLHTAQCQQAERGQSVAEQSPYRQERSGQHPRSATISGAGSAGPYGLGFSYGHMPGYQAQAQQPPSTMTAQPHADISQYRRDSYQQLGGIPTSYAHYQPTEFAAPQLPQHSHFGGRFATQGFQQAYSTQASEAQPPHHPQPVQQYGQSGYAPMQQRPSYSYVSGSNPPSPTDTQDHCSDGAHNVIPHY